MMAFFVTALGVCLIMVVAIIGMVYILIRIGALPPWSE